MHLCLRCWIESGESGSHHNENFFGQVKKMGSYDESIEGFRKAIEKTLLMRQLHQHFDLSVSPPGRNSMSGVRIPTEAIEELPPIGHYFHAALSLLELVTPYDNTELSRAINAFQEANGLPPWKRPDDALTLLPESLVSKVDQKPLKGVTLRSRRQVNISGFCCKVRFITAGQATGASLRLVTAQERGTLSKKVNSKNDSHIRSASDRVPGPRANLRTFPWNRDV